MTRAPSAPSLAPHLPFQPSRITATALLKRLTPAAGLLALLAGPAHASMVTTQQYDFVGTCSDCAGQVHAELLLQNYVAGNYIT